MKLLASLLIAFAALAAPAFADTITIPTGTAIVVQTNDTYSSKNIQTGQSISMSVSADVRIDGFVVIKSGAAVLANVSHASDAGAIGEGGSLSLNVTAVYAVDGKLVPVTGTKSSTGDDETTGTVVAGVVLCPLILLNKGEDAVIGSGTQFRVITISETDVTAE